MSIIRYIKKLELLDSLIRKKATGNQEEFCRKAKMSRSLLNNYINEMRELGFPIDFDRKRGTYFYTEEGQLVSRLFERKMDRDEFRDIEGGCCVGDEQLMLFSFYSPHYYNPVHVNA
jgi:biotin operon repressor